MTVYLQLGNQVLAYAGGELAPANGARTLAPVPAAPTPPAAPPCVAQPPYTTIPEVIRAMRRRWRALQRARDWRAVFARSYLRTTEQVLAAAKGGRAFENPAWLTRLDCDFAGRYFTAADCWDARGACPAPWALAFRAATEKRTLVLQDLLLGMNAHINYDLPYALDATIPPNLDAAALAPYYRDHERMNALLARTVGVVQAAASAYDPAIALANAGLGRGGQEGVAQLISLWRERSWAHFLLLRQAGDRAAVDGLIAQTAGEYGLLLLQLQQVAPYLYWPNRLYRDTIGWLRGWRA
jgi:hypothetical protein